LSIWSLCFWALAFLIENIRFVKVKSTNIKALNSEFRFDRFQLLKLFLFLFQTWMSKNERANLRSIWFSQNVIIHFDYYWVERVGLTHEETKLKSSSLSLYSLSLPLPHTQTLSHSLTHSLSHTLSLSHTHSLCHTHSLSLIHTHTISHTHTHSHKTHLHTHTHTHTHKQTDTRVDGRFMFLTLDQVTWKNGMDTEWK